MLQRGFYGNVCVCVCLSQENGIEAVFAPHPCPTWTLPWDSLPGAINPTEGKVKSLVAFPFAFSIFLLPLHSFLCSFGLLLFHFVFTFRSIAFHLHLFLSTLNRLSFLPPPSLCDFISLPTPSFFHPLKEKTNATLYMKQEGGLKPEPVLLCSGEFQWQLKKSNGH